MADAVHREDESQTPGLNPSPPDAISADDEATADSRGATARLLFLGVAPLLFSCFYLWQVLDLPEAGRPLVVSPRAWPLIIAIGMLAVSIVMTVVVAMRRSRAFGGDSDDEELDTRDLLVTVAAIVIFALVFERLGFLISTTLLVAGLSSLVAPSHWKRNIIVSAAFAVLASLLFTSALGVHLPPGILTLPV